MSGLWCGLVGENKFCICTCGLLFAGYSIPQVADRWLAGLELSVFQKVTQKVWFVVLVGLLLGLACGAVMARWPGLRPTAAGVAVVGALLLGRVVGWLRQVVLGLATGLLAVATAPFARRFGVSELTWAIGLGFLVGVVWRIVGAMRRRGGSGCSHACAVCALSSGDVKLSKQYHRSPGVMCPDTGQPCTKGCDATAKPCDRNGSVHPNSVPPIDENAQIERLARLLHDAGRSAVEPSGAFVEWDDAPERTRAGRRSQAQYLLAAGVVLPDDSALDRIAADVAELRRLAEPAKLTIPPSSVTVNASNPADAEAAKRFIFQTLADGLRKPVTVNGNAVCPLWRQLGNLCPCSRDGSLDHAAYCETGPGKNSQGWSVGEAVPSAAVVGKPIAVSLDDFQAPPRKPIESYTPQPLQSFPTDEEIRAWRWWERLPAEYPHTAKQIVELYFDSDGQLLARDRVAGIAQTALPPVVLRYGDPLLTGKDLESVSFGFYRADQWRKVPAPITTQIAQQAADREAAAK